MLTAVDQYVDDPRRRKETRRSMLIKRLLSGICCISGKFLGNYLMVLYLFIKLSFIANCISQLFVLNLLLGHEFHKFGFELIDKIINGKGWDTGSRIFPKISMCDFRIREVGNPKVSHRYTVQCVLPINLFNQQIFTFIWFWYFIVLIVNFYSLCVWTYRFLPSNRLRYISRRIEIMRQALFWRHKNTPLNFEQMPDLEMHDFEKDLIRHFVQDYLESDGLFILRVLSSNTSDFVCTELIQELWKYYRKQRKFNRTSDSDGTNDELNDEDLNSMNNKTHPYQLSHNNNNKNFNLDTENTHSSTPSNFKSQKTRFSNNINNQTQNRRHPGKDKPNDDEIDKKEEEEDEDHDDDNSKNASAGHSEAEDNHHDDYEDDVEEQENLQDTSPPPKSRLRNNNRTEEESVAARARKALKKPLSEQLSNIYTKPKKPENTTNAILNNISNKVKNIETHTTNNNSTTASSQQERPQKLTLADLEEESSMAYHHQLLEKKQRSYANASSSNNVAMKLGVKITSPVSNESKSLPNSNSNNEIDSKSLLLRSKFQETET